MQITSGVMMAFRRHLSLPTGQRRVGSLLVWHDGSSWRLQQGDGGGGTGCGTAGLTGRASGRVMEGGKREGVAQRALLEEASRQL